ncbi:AraC family transcriptional regulator [Sphingobacterium thalpophilum]|uniref:Adenosine deaminase n=1 Tax=Sphingobacterium thalpophilum TaxID=259 RepID=A0A4U9UF64_9SPHI|nr:helix-turn-helix domain-containing protein [Sphingobacterium thalpophilum]VTR27831.1 Adenosine deaminase [Sphingobacterium thalpophilum]
MERSYQFRLPEDFKGTDRPQMAFSYPIRHAQQLHWQSGHNQISEQVFDGRYVYLYYYEYWIAEAMDIPIDITMPDVHLIYPLFTDEKIYGQRIGHGFTFELSSSRGAFFYLSTGYYKLQLPPGHHILVGFIMDGGMIRPPVIQQFGFIEHLIQAKKNRHSLPLKSVDFRVGPITLKYLQILFGRINPYTLKNEQMLLKHLIFLIDLSRFKLPDAQDVSLPLAERARQLLEHMVFQLGARAQIKEVAQILGVTPEQLSRSYQARFGIRPLDHRNQLLLIRIEQLIVEDDKLATTADEAGFSGPSEMNRFIRHMANMTASQFKIAVEKKLNL